MSPRPRLKVLLILGQESSAWVLVEAKEVREEVMVLVSTWKSVLALISSQAFCMFDMVSRWSVEVLLVMLVLRQSLLELSSSSHCEVLADTSATPESAQYKDKN